MSCAGLLQQVVETAAAAGVPLSGENALQRYDHFAFDRIAESAFGHQARAGCLESLTFLRMGEPSLLHASNAEAAAPPCFPDVGLRHIQPQPNEYKQLHLLWLPCISCHPHRYATAGDLMFDNWDAFSDFLRRMRTPPSDD